MTADGTYYWTIYKLTNIILYIQFYNGKPCAKFFVKMK